MTNIRNALMQAAGTAASGDPVYVEDCFNIDLYVGTGYSTGSFYGNPQTIVNGIDYSGDGGMVWFRERAGAINHAIYDTERGATKALMSDAVNGEYADATSMTSFNNNGYTLGNVGYNNFSVNKLDSNYVAWNFKKQKGFFDVVTYEGNGSNRTISHNLGCKPGMIIIKMYDASGYKWRVWHKSLGANYALCLNDNSVPVNGSASDGFWNSGVPTSSVFSVGTYGQVNNNGNDFVAYLFADGDESDAQIFGDDGDEAIIKCGSYTGNSSTPGVQVDCGFEPQLVLIKRTSATAEWQILDNMRGAALGASDAVLHPDTTDAEYAQDIIEFNATGFQTVGGSSNTNAGDYIYMAIRRGPMKEPTAGTDLLDIETYTGNGNAAREFSFDITPDFIYQTNLGGATYSEPALHFRNGQAIKATDAVYTSALKFDRSKAVYTTSLDDKINQNSESYLMYAFKRFPKAIDILTYDSFDETSLTTYNQPHKLGVQPELVMIAPYYVAQGSTSVNGAFKMWWQLAADYKYSTYTSTDSAASWWADPTANHIVLSTNNNMSFWDVPGPNVKGYMVILFASLDGIIDIGEYTHSSTNGGTVSVTTGFQPRFIMLQHDDGGAWTQFDTVRGISSSNDPHFEWASTSAQTTSVDVFQSINSTGFVIESANGGNNASFNTNASRKSRYIAIA